MLEKVLFWRVNSTTLTSDLNSVNNVFIKLITKLEKIRKRLSVVSEKNQQQITKLQIERDKLSVIDRDIQTQIEKYEGMIELKGR